MLIETLDTTAKKWEQFKYLWSDEYINKIWHVHVMEYIICQEKKWNTDACYNMAQTWKHYANWKKAVTKDHMYDFTYMKCPKQTNL